jgi:putative lipoprotein
MQGRIGTVIGKAILTIACLLILFQSSWADLAIEVDTTKNHQSSDATKANDRWWAKDKLQHLGISAFLSGVSYDISRRFYRNTEESSIYVSVSFTLTMGLGKEFYDRRSPGGRFSFKDLVADLTGIALGLLIATR